MHAIERARQRYGVVLTAADLVELSKTIGASPLLRRLEGGTEHRLLMWKGTAMIAVVNLAKNFIITFLPRNSRQKLSKKGT
jgi:hypothetical protein